MILLSSIIFGFADPGYGFNLVSLRLTISIVLALAVVQILVHIIYFLHLDTRSEGGWNLMAFIFTAVLVVIVLGASIWVMYTATGVPGEVPAQTIRTMEESIRQIQ